MELNQLQQLIVIADERALFRAAKKLHISQSALTRSIQRLEDELGIQLFDRTHNSMKLNEAGKLVVRHARLVLKEAESLVTGINAFKRDLKTLHIVTCTPAPLWKLTAELSKQFPDIHMTSAMPEESELVSQLLTEKASIAITRQEIHIDEIDSMPFMDEHLLIRIPLSDPLSHKASVWFSDLRGQEISEYVYTGFWRRLYRDCIKDARYIEYDDIMVYLNIVASQNLLTFTSDAHDLQLEMKNYILVPIADKEATAHCYIVWLKKNKPNLADILNWISNTCWE